MIPQPCVVRIVVGPFFDMWGVLCRQVSHRLWAKEARAHRDGKAKTNVEKNDRRSTASRKRLDDDLRRKDEEEEERRRKAEPRRRQDSDFHAPRSLDAGTVKRGAADLGKTHLHVLGQCATGGM